MSENSFGRNYGDVVQAKADHIIKLLDNSEKEPSIKALRECSQSMSDPEFNRLLKMVSYLNKEGVGYDLKLNAEDANRKPVKDEKNLSFTYQIYDPKQKMTKEDRPKPDLSDLINKKPSR